MPTLTWIQDSASDRRTDAFPFQNDWKPEPIHCPLCALVFTDPAVLSSHLGLDHPLKLPMLRIGSGAGSTKFIVREKCALEDVEAFSTTACRLSTNGAEAKAITPKQLGPLLQASGNAHHRIWLQNERGVDGRAAESELEVQVAIPDNSVLKEIDDIFSKTLAIDRPTMADVDRFLQLCPHDTVATDYAGALHDSITWTSRRW